LGKLLHMIKIKMTLSHIGMEKLNKSFKK